MSLACGSAGCGEEHIEAGAPTSATECMQPTVSGEGTFAGSTHYWRVKGVGVGDVCGGLGECLRDLELVMEGRL